MEQAELQPARHDRAFVKTFPCTGCGAKLSFSPGTKELACEYCGTANPIPEGGANVEELDFDTYLEAMTEYRAHMDYFQTSFGGLINPVFKAWFTARRNEAQKAAP